MQRRQEFKCLRCGRCCQAGLLVPLTSHDFQDWFLNRCYLPIILTVKEYNEVVEELGLDYVYTILSHRHNSYRYIREILAAHRLNLPEVGCALYTYEYNTCRVYARRPLVCRLFPFTSALTIYEWARNNCEAVKQGYTLATRDLIKIADLYAREVDRTYGSKTVLEKIENIRRQVIEKFLPKFIRDVGYLEELKYYLLKNVEYVSVTYTYIESEAGESAPEETSGEDEESESSETSQT